MKKVVVFAAAFALATLLCAAVAFAAPPCPGEKTLAQPDGQTIAATLNGDERLHWYETGAGDVVVRGEDGWWRYAAYENGALKALDAKAGVDGRPAGAAIGKDLERAARGKAPAGTTAARAAAANLRAGGIAGPQGPEKMLVILISFSDVKIRQTDAYWSGKMFANYSSYAEKTDAHSSVNDYYKENSGGKFYFTPAAETSGAAGDGVVRVTLPMAHPRFADATFDADSNAVASAALKAANASINFAAFDADRNGDVSAEELHVVMILAGGEQSYGDVVQAVWAHSFALAAPLALDSVTVGSDYTEQGEYQGDHPATIGVLAHELGHSLGLPDLYDYGDSDEDQNESLGVGVYSLMAGGSWEYNGGSQAGSSPTHLDAWSKYLLGFTVPQTFNSGTRALNSLATHAYNVIRLDTTDPNQYFLLENRQTNYGYDKPLYYECAAGGVAVWHIDYNVLNNCQTKYQGWYYVNDVEEHKAVDLEEANEGILGYSELDDNIDPWDASGGRYNHLYRTGSTACNSSFNALTDPSSDLYDGSASGVSVDVTTPAANTMKVNLGLRNIGVTPDKPSPRLQNRTVRWTCAADGAKNITYKFDVTKDSASVGGTGGYSAQAWFDWTPAEPGAYTVTAYALASGVETPLTSSAVFTVTADTAPPVITAAAGGAALARGDVRNADVTARAADPDGGAVAAYSYAKDGGAPVAGWPAQFTDEAAYVLTARDLAGNEATFAFGIDKTAPVISAMSAAALSEGMTAGADVSVTAADSSAVAFSAVKDGAAYAWPAGGIFTEPGVYAVTAADAAGNRSVFRFGILPYGDKLLVTAGGRCLTDGSVTNEDVSVGLADPGWTLTVSRNGADGGAQPFTAEGVYEATASDGAGHTVTLHFIIDRAAPKLTARDASGAAVAAGAARASAVTVTVVDTSPLVKAARRNGAAVAWPADGKFAADGRYALTVTDAAGHSATLSFSVDLTAPLIAVTASGTRVWNNGYARAGATVAVADASAVKKTVTKNGKAVSWPSGGVFTSEGVYVVTATDVFARKSTLKFTLDKTLPAVTGRQSTGAAAVSGGYYHRSVTVTVSDKYLASKTVTKNGKTMAWPSRSRFSSTGAYVVTARDKAGNTRVFSFVVDTAKPVISVRTPAGAAVKPYGTAWGGAVVTVSDGWLASKTAKLGAKAVAWPSANKFTAKGTYYITAKDKAGNMTTVKFYIK